MPVAVAILAAGAGSRLGSTVPKPLVEVAGRPLIAYAYDAAATSGLKPIVVVAAHNDVIHAMPSDAIRLLNRSAHTGIASSVSVAIRALKPLADVEAVTIGLADQPLVGPEAYRRLVDAYHAGANLAVATYGGVRGNPVLIGRDLWDEALQLEGDEGARQLMRRHPVVEVPCDGTGDPFDIDTSEDLDEIRRRLSG